MSKLKMIAIGGALLAVFPATAAAAGATANTDIEKERRNYMSFAGYTGLFHIPTAEVLAKGYFDFSYNNQLDYRGNAYLDGHNFVFAAGIFDGLEISGMIATNTIHDDLFKLKTERERGLHNETQKRDLSFNLKYQLPVIPADWFSMAVGVKDFGGAANQYETYYVAASKEWRDFRFSTGVGSNSRAHGQMNGVFAGVEWQPLEWFALQVEHDAEAINAGARVTIPERWLFNIGTITLTSRFYSNTDIAEHGAFWGINFTMPFSRQAQGLQAVSAPEQREQTGQTQHARSAPAAPPAAAAAPAPVATPTTAAAPATTTPAATARGTDYTPQNSPQNTQHAHEEAPSTLMLQARNLRAALLRDGFEGVSVGFNLTPHIVVSFENYRFNRNDLDALGVVMGRISEHVHEAGAKFSVQLVNHGLPMLAIAGDVDNYRAFIAGEAAPSLQVQRGAMQAVSGIAWVGMPNANSPYFKPRLTVGPSLSTRIATELGVYDYSLALDANVQVPMWRGGGVSVSAQTPVANTDDYEPGRPFGRFLHDGGVSHAAVYHTLALPYGFYNQTHVGFFQEFNDFVGVKNELMWLSESGRHQVSTEYAYLEYTKYNGSAEYQTVAYRYNWLERDISFHGEAGRFFYRDEGFRVEARFWFGDSYVALFAHDTDVRVAGIGFSIPLTPRREMRATRYGQVTGNRAWRHGVSSRIGESDNALAIGRAHTLVTPVGLERNFFNQGRLSPGYVHNNLARLREAYRTYR